jgi:hypothetical protein
MHTMAALEKALVMNPIPLLQFAATKDFTGENIVFLMQVRDWHTTWRRFSGIGNALTNDGRSTLYDLALEIYISSVHEKTAEFPINIESKIKRELDLIFEAVASERRPYRDDSIADPFKDHSPHDPFRTTSVELTVPKNLRGILERANTDETEPIANNSSQENIIPSSKDFMFDVNPCVRPPVRQSTIPGFDEQVFDQAEQSIKYLVLTNTWQKFVMEHNVISP